MKLMWIIPENFGIFHASMHHLNQILGVILLLLKLEGYFMINVLLQEVGVLNGLVVLPKTVKFMYHFCSISLFMHFQFFPHDLGHNFHECDIPLMRLWIRGMMMGGWLKRHLSPSLSNSGKKKKKFRRNWHFLVFPCWKISTRGHMFHWSWILIKIGKNFV
jgi:hypothetical protein